MTNNEVLEDVQKTAIQLILKEPFYGHFFNHLNREVVDGKHPVTTAAISMSPRTNLLSLLINNEFWTKKIWSADAQKWKDAKYWIIKHEILHILFKHIFNYHKYGDKTLANIAIDFVVHQCILIEKIPEDMRSSLALLENYPHFFPNINNDKTGSDNHQTSDYYYKILQTQADEIRETLKGGESSDSGDGQGDDQDRSGQSDCGDGDQDGDGEGESQSGGGLESNKNWGKLNESQKNLAKFMQNDENRQVHSTWKDISKLNKGQKEFTNSWVDGTIEEVVKKLDRSKKEGNSNWRGKLPAGLVAYLDELIANLQPTVNWKRQLRRFAANGENSRLETTLKRRSKRYNTFPGTKIKQSCKVMIAIDTSGSVDNESLIEFFSEINWIYKTEAQVHIVECDVAIGKTWDYKGNFPGEITGRGGTDFNAPILYANEEYRPDCLIYFTDGEAPPPVKCGCPIMWIISKNQGCTVDQMSEFQGIKIKMDF